MAKNLHRTWLGHVAICILSLATIRCGPSPAIRSDPIVDIPPQVDLSECSWLSGRYVFLGEPLVGMPDYFRVRAIPLSLDVMLGFEIPAELSQKTTAVSILIANGLQLTFLSGQDVLQRSMPYQRLDQVHCDQKTLTIEKRRQTTGEAVRGSTVVTHTLSLDESMALILTTDLTGRSHSFIFSWDRPHEIYGARFRRLAE